MTVIHQFIEDFTECGFILYCPGPFWGKSVQDIKNYVSWYCRLLKRPLVRGSKASQLILNFACSFTCVHLMINYKTDNTGFLNHNKLFRYSMLI